MCHPTASLLTTPKKRWERENEMERAREREREREWGVERGIIGYLLM